MLTNLQFVLQQSLVLMSMSKSYPLSILTDIYKKTPASGSLLRNASLAFALLMRQNPQKDPSVHKAEGKLPKGGETTLLLNCPNCKSMDHLSNWVYYTAKTLRMNIIPAAKSPAYVRPKCLITSTRTSLPCIDH